MSSYPRVLGVLITGWGVLAVAKPGVITQHAELGDPASPPAAAVRLSRTIGIRDIASGLAMLTLRSGRPLQGAVLARVCFDIGDAIYFGCFPPTKRARVKVAAAAAGVALLCASSLPSAGAS